MSNRYDVAVGRRVRVCRASSEDRFGAIVDDFADSAANAITVGDTRIAQPSRRWAIVLDDKTLIFADSANLHRSQDNM